MKKRVFIIHGWGGDPESNWFPWMKIELEKHDLEVVVPQMPNADFPIRAEWLAYMQELIDDVDENTFLIGHSLGVIAILQLLESLPADKKVGGIILVAGFSESLGTIPEIENFFASPIDYEKIKLVCKKIVAINSDDDPYIPIEKGKILQDKLDAKLIIVENAGHLNAGTGYFELPIALEKLLEMAK